jgi:hypothetical protein
VFIVNSGEQIFQGVHFSELFNSSWFFLSCSAVLVLFNSESSFAILDHSSF